MKGENKHTIYTIGHSTHSSDEFIKMLRSFHIKVLADIRQFPGSKKFPRFNKENLAAELEKAGIDYIHLVNLGGRRPVKKDSVNIRWQNASFRGYADYMESEDFKTAIYELQRIALKKTTAYMCSEAVWWRCHRSMVSDYLKAKGWRVLHIMAENKAEDHPYTSPARIVGECVYYHDEDLFSSMK